MNSEFTVVSEQKVLSKFWGTEENIKTICGDKIIMPMAEHVFVQSEKMKKDIALMGIPERKMTAVPMGICLAQFLTTRMPLTRKTA